ncbi:hypothetical protein CLA01_14170 [Chryseobacterium lathyri]|uniref:Uncharacterized protein n=1 Tax=Chryseobacterium lathyri TaxID=395933 RepID=A0A511Y827_9FLAO|nr:hypothetical protein CLA01_14170 [Chryseobacterium lathyri]
MLHSLHCHQKTGSHRTLTCNTVKIKLFAKEQKFIEGTPQCLLKYYDLRLSLDGQSVFINR